MVEFDYAIYSKNPNNYTYCFNKLIYEPQSNFDAKSSRVLTAMDEWPIMYQYNSRVPFKLSSFKKMAYKFYYNNFPQLFYKLCYSENYAKMKFWLLNHIHPDDFSEQEIIEMSQFKRFSSVDEVKTMINFFKIKSPEIHIQDFTNFDVVKYFYTKNIINKDELVTWFTVNCFSFSFDYKMIDFMFETFPNQFKEYCLLAIKTSTNILIRSLVYAMRRTNHQFDDSIIQLLFEMERFDTINKIKEHVKINFKLFKSS